MAKKLLAGWRMAIDRDINEFVRVDDIAGYKVSLRDGGGLLR
jgi:hypothetical protein